MTSDIGQKWDRCDFETSESFPGSVCAAVTEVEQAGLPFRTVEWWSAYTSQLCRFFARFKIGPLDGICTLGRSVGW